MSARVAGRDGNVHCVRVRCVESFSELGGADERAGERPPGRRGGEGEDALASYKKMVQAKGHRSTRFAEHISCVAYNLTSL